MLIDDYIITPLEDLWVVQSPTGQVVGVCASNDGALDTIHAIKTIRTLGAADISRNPGPLKTPTPEPITKNSPVPHEIIEKDGEWIVLGPYRTIVCETKLEAMRVAAGPTGLEKKCAGCNEPISHSHHRPLGVKASGRSGYCTSCTRRLAPPRKKAYRSTPCKGCGRTMFVGPLANEGEVHHHSGGRCQPCHNRHKNGIPVPLDPDYECSMCGEQVYTGYDVPEGKRSPSYGGICRSCRNAVKTHKTKRNPYYGDVCAGTCGRTLRGRGGRKTPKLAPHHKDGYCEDCYEPIGEKNATVDNPSLVAYLKGRQNRAERAHAARKAQAIEQARRAALKKRSEAKS